MARLVLGSHLPGLFAACWGWLATFGVIRQRLGLWASLGNRPQLAGPAMAPLCQQRARRLSRGWRWLAMRWLIVSGSSSKKSLSCTTWLASSSTCFDLGPNLDQTDEQDPSGLPWPPRSYSGSQCATVTPDKAPVEEFQWDHLEHPPWVGLPPSFFFF